MNRLESLRLSAMWIAVLLTSHAATALLAEDWPQWMGKNRDDVWRETGIVETFPADGPKVLWRRPIHGGFSGPAVVGGRVYVMDYEKLAGDAQPNPTKRNELQGRERVLCLDSKTGTELWRHEYACSYTISYPACRPAHDCGGLRSP